MYMCTAAMNSHAEPLLYTQEYDCIYRLIIVRTRTEQYLYICTAMIVHRELLMHMYIVAMSIHVPSYDFTCRAMTAYRSICIHTEPLVYVNAQSYD